MTPNNTDNYPPLHQRIKTEIAEQGPIAFARFVELALYQPGEGYYARDHHIFGKKGDFVTSPVISPLFSQCLALQCQQILNGAGQDILEFGAGSGILAVALLSKLEQLNRLPEHYYIMEISAALRQAQQDLLQQHLPHLLAKVIWLDELPQKPFSGVVIGNEVLDAMPVNQFQMTAEGINEIFININGDQFVAELMPPSAKLMQQVSAYQLNLAEHYRSEVLLTAQDWLARLSNSLHQGLVLLIDYGFPRHEYYHPDRSMGTLMCHYQHQPHDNPLIHVGNQDITAHVDFTLIAEAAVDVGFEIEGFTNQAAFLLNCGLTDLLQDITDTDAKLKAHAQVNQLTSPNEMGELFKVIGLGKNLNDTPLGFKQFDQRARL